MSLLLVIVDLSMIFENRVHCITWLCIVTKTHLDYISYGISSTSRLVMRYENSLYQNGIYYNGRFWVAIQYYNEEEGMVDLT
jgi:hypothetical protein